jgi:oxaloacetate decarboxylase alpha subunit
MDRAAGTDRGRTILAGEPDQPSLADIRREYGKNLTDEELLLRYLMPAPDVDAMYAAAQPIEPILPIGGIAGMGWLKDVLHSTAGRSITATRGDVTISLRR